MRLSPFKLKLAYTVYIYQKMNQILAFLLFVNLAFSQILIQLPSTLVTLSQAVSGIDTSQAKAIRYLFQTHPDLANHTVTSINTQINRSNQSYADNLQDFLFQLTFNSKQIRALVTLSISKKMNYVTLSPIVSSSPPPPKGKYSVLAEYTMLAHNSKTDEAINSPIMNQSVSSDIINNESDTGKSNTAKKQPLNAFIQYQDFNDPFVQNAFDIVASSHPNIINYRIMNVYYQLVAGLIIKIVYHGKDNYSKVTAIISFDLKLTPNLVSFKVDCIKNDNYCNPLAAQSIYQSIESILVFHPQLFSYGIQDFIVENKITAGAAAKVMITFQNKAQKLRALIEEEINLNKATVLSYYTYSYDQ